MSDFPCRWCGEKAPFEVGSRCVMVFCECGRVSFYSTVGMTAQPVEGSSDVLTRDGQIEVKGWGWGV